MAERRKFVGHTTAALATFTGLLNEFTVDITKRVAVVHDNSTAGGFPLAREDLSNVSNATNSSAGKASAAHITELESLRTDLTAAESDISTNTTSIAALGTASAINTGDILQYAMQAGTKAVFYQDSAPTAWTRDTTINDFVLGVVSAGSPGTTTGSWTISGLTVPGHTHTFSGNTGPASDGSNNTTSGPDDLPPTGHQHTFSGTTSNSGTLNVSSSGAWRPATAQVLLATKDAHP